MDGRLLALDPPTPSSYLAQAPRGAYTALRLPRPFFAVDWAQHVARLEQSIGLLHEAGLVDYGAWHVSGGGVYGHWEPDGSRAGPLRRRAVTLPPGWSLILGRPRARPPHHREWKARKETPSPTCSS